MSVERKMGPMQASDGRFVIRKCLTKSTNAYRLIFDWAKPGVNPDLTFGHMDVKQAYDAIHMLARKMNLPVCQYACKANKALKESGVNPNWENAVWTCHVNWYRKPVLLASPVGGSTSDLDAIDWR